MKTVIHVWTHKFNINVDHIKKYNYLNEENFYFGLGDLMRSTIKLFHLSKTMNFKLIVDIQLHPMSEFLLVQSHPYSDYVLQNKNNVDYVCYGALEDYINETNSHVLMILTNDFFDGELSEECRNFMKNIFTPNEKFQKFIDLKMSYIPYEKYNIMHYRVNDNEFLNKSQELVYNMYTDHLKTYKEANDILVTDTKSLKNHIFLYDNIYLFDLKICHLGLSTDSDAIRDTLFEFFLITKSAKIKTYCKIHQISGFVKWISKIYNIPLTHFNY